MKFSRRKFDTLVLAGAAATALSLGFAGTALAQNASSVTIPADKIGVAGFSLGGDFGENTRNILEQVTACGIENIEFTGSRLADSPPAFQGVSVADLKAYSEEFGFKVPSLGISGADVADRLDIVIEVAKELGAEYVRISGAPNVENESDADYYARLAQLMNGAGAALAEEGIILAYHNHEGEFLADLGNGQSGYDYLLAEVDPANAVFELDTLWAAVGGVDPAVLMQEHPGQFAMLHVRDGLIITNAEGEPDADDTNVGDGEINFEAIFAQAEVAGVEWFIMEIGSPQPDGITATCASLDYLLANFT